MDSNGVGSSRPKSVDAIITEQLSRNNPKSNSRNAANRITSGNDPVNLDMSEVYKSLTILGDEIISKLDEILKADLPDGIRSLDPEDHTSEATAQRIVDGTTGLFGIFQKQNSDLEGEELISKFMSTIRGGIDQGSSQAKSILGELGAFEFDGVESGISKTLSLVEEKLKAFEEGLRAELTPAETETEIAESENFGTAAS